MAEPITEEITQANVDASYRLLAYIALIQVALDAIELGPPQQAEIIGAVQLTLQATAEIAEGLHDKLEGAVKARHKAEFEPSCACSA